MTATSSRRRYRGRVTDSSVTTASGVRIACSELGVEGGPLVVMLHALGERGSDWDGTVRDRFAQSCRTLTLDLRGHGASDWPGEYSVALMSGDVEQVLDGLGVTGVVMVGHSLGGAVAFDLVERRPDLVRALVAEDVAPTGPRAPRPVPARPEAALPFDWDVVVAIRAEADRGDPRLLDALADIRTPTLIVAGGPQSTVDQGLLEQAASRLPHGTLRTVASGHYVHREQPEAFCDVVLEWLAELDGAPGGPSTPTLGG